MFDFLIACFIFFIVFSLITGFWQKSYDSIIAEEKQNALRQKAETAVDFLLSNPGVPQNWQSKPLSQVQKIGLVSTPLVLDSRKVDALAGYALVFSSADYNKTTELLGISGYNYFIQIDSVQDKNISQKRSANYSITILRTATYNGNSAKIFFTLYEASS